jgi:hypothetical protein
MAQTREDVNAMFTADTAVRGEEVEFAMGGGRRVRMRVTVTLRRHERDAAYSLVNNAHIVAADDGEGGCFWRTYTVRQGLWIRVVVKNLGNVGEAGVVLRSSWSDDHETHRAGEVTLQPQQEYTLPEPLQLRVHETQNKWNLFFDDMPLARLVLVFKRDADGEETIRELLFAMKKVVDAYG